MKTLILKRYKTGPDGTFGEIGTAYYTLENQELQIPEGEYPVEWKNHPKHGWCYELQNVPGRTAILIHPANYRTELLGCIALGLSVGLIGNKKGIGSSKQAVGAFNKEMGGQPFIIKICGIDS